MNLSFNLSVVEGYKSASQKARILTESWVKNNIYCPACGNGSLKPFPSNNPVGDFLCICCKSEYELKSKKDNISSKIVDGAYSSMIQRINSNNNPNFFFLSYSSQYLRVINFFVIPKYYFINDIIEKRKPLSSTAKRAGWVGCNIILENIPNSGRIFFVKNGLIENQEIVLENWRKTSFLSNETPIKRRWSIEIMRMVEEIPNKNFTIQDLYKNELDLKGKFPHNNFIKDKIRQQVQILRNKGLIEFLVNGSYRKTLL